MLNMKNLEMAKDFRKELYDRYWTKLHKLFKKEFRAKSKYQSNLCYCIFFINVLTVHDLKLSQTFGGHCL